MLAKEVDPRIERTRALVLRAAVEIVAEMGFSGATIDAIAQQAGVARSTIYRHWPQRMELLLEAVGTAMGPIEQFIVGDLKADLVAISTHLVKTLTSEPLGSVSAALILESRRDSAINDLRKRFVEQRKNAAGQVIAAAMDRGELRADTKPETMIDELAAPIFFQALVLQQSADRKWIQGHVDRWLDQYRSS